MRIVELIDTEVETIPFDRNPNIGWWADQEYLTVYHGTHDRNVDSILKNGLNRPDPITGMISVTCDPYTAYGYAAMSGAGGEANFRSAKAKPVHVPGTERAVIKMSIPIGWLFDNMDENLSGNIGYAKEHLQSREAYIKWKEENKPDYAFYQTSEFRLKKPIPANFIVGVMKK